MKYRRAVWLVLSLAALLIFQNLRLSIRTAAADSSINTASFLEGFLPSIPSNNGVSACLMVRDDNLLIPEWIAYHYTVLPLRDLVIATDLGSTQDVSLIVNKWKSHMNITTWNASHFIHRFGEIPVPMNDTNHHYLHRQRAFITSCAEYFKALNKTWVAFVDTDEYVAINRMVFDETHREISNTTESIVMRQRRAVLQHSTTVLDAIRAAETVSPLLPCHGMPRLLYGALENITCEEARSVRDLLRQYEFAYVPTTIRYVQHATKGAYFPNKWGKVLVDVSRLSWDSLGHKPKSSHRPFAECRKPLFEFNESILQVNHYLGSWERYSSRSDDRRSRRAFEERAYFSDGVSCNDELWEWFPRFVNEIGVEKAREMLRVRL